MNKFALIALLGVVGMTGIARADDSSGEQRQSDKPVGQQICEMAQSAAESLEQRPYVQPVVPMIERMRQQWLDPNCSRPSHSDNNNQNYHH